MENILNTYINKLQSADWYYEYSDDFGAHENGRKQMNELHELAKTVDPNFKIWNQYCPIEKYLQNGGNA
jgi:hypothetical protein